MIDRKRLFIVITGIFLLCQFGLAQFDDEEDVAKFKVFKSYDCIHPGMELRIAVKATIKGMWHINSNEPSEDYMIGTSVEIPAGGTFELKEVIYPEPFELMLGIADSPMSVYEGEIIIRGSIPIPEDIGLGSHKIPIHINYQACNDTSCLPPRSVKKEISIDVVDANTPIKEINKEIFAKLSEQNQ
ncbi:protein-disulfide reductase DsbD domain-containing protein [Acidobacteriota bacterium]